MADLKCTDCGALGSYADAQMLDIRGTCEKGEKHDWFEV